MYELYLIVVDFHFPNDQWSWASINKFDECLYIFSGKMSSVLPTF